jgi:hypothetical protein
MLVPAVSTVAWVVIGVVVVFFVFGAVYWALIRRGEEDLDKPRD